MIADVLRGLDPKDQRFLTYALENGLTQYVELSGGKFIGVNTHYLKHLHTEESVGVWSYGTNKQKE